MEHFEQNIIPYFFNKGSLQEITAQWTANLADIGIPIPKVDIVGELKWDDERPTQYMLKFEICMKGQRHAALIVNIESTKQLVAPCSTGFRTNEEFAEGEKALTAMLKHETLVKLVMEYFEAMKIEASGQKVVGEGPNPEYVYRYRVDPKIETWKYDHDQPQQLDDVSDTSSICSDFQEVPGYSQGTGTDVAYDQPGRSNSSDDLSSYVARTSSVEPRPFTWTGVASSISKSFSALWKRPE